MLAPNGIPEPVLAERFWRARTSRMNLQLLADRIRSLRTSAGFTLEQLAEKTGMPRGMISKVENFRVTPSLPTLAKIAEAFGISTSQLLAGLDERSSLVIVRRDERQEQPASDPASAVRTFALAHKRAIKRMEPLLWELSPGKSQEATLRASDEAFLMLLDGSIELTCGPTTHRLEPGDCAYGDGVASGTEAGGWLLKNVGRSIARAIVVQTSSARSAT
jgi:transcriptional regulator with XRE-family HTH domain